MFVRVYDPQRLILFILSPPGGEPRDNESAIEAIERLIADAAKRPVESATIVITVEDDSALPDASQRRRLADCMRRLPRHHLALISRSVLARAVMTALNWLAPPAAGASRSKHASYADALPCLVKHTTHSIDVLDAAHREMLRHPSGAPGAAARTARHQG